jgi:hypothetical protein
MMDDRRLGYGTMLSRKGGSTTPSFTGRVPGGEAVIAQVYAFEGFQRESIRRECQAIVQTFSAKSTEDQYREADFHIDA